MYIAVSGFSFTDMVEGIWDYFKKQDDASYDDPKAPEFEKELNDFFVRKGIGWKLENGQILVRGQEAFEATVKSASAILKNTGRPTAGNHMHEALVALSRRPTPDFSGAMYHAMGCLECVARDVTGQPKDTLGKIMKDHPDLVPAPLDEVVGKIWGYASNQARHVVEGREPELAEAELLVGLSASVSMYLSKKLGLNK